MEVPFNILDCAPGRLITIIHENIVDLYNNKMAEYAQDFQNQAQSLLSYVQGQLANVVSWTALPGVLSKIVASPTGFVWGFNSAGDVYTCKEPCDGQNWRGVDAPPGRSGMPSDIAVDGDNVYILYTSTVTSVKLDGKWTFLNGRESGDLVQSGNSWTFTPSNPAAVSLFGWTQLRGTFDTGSTTSGQQVYITPSRNFPMSFTIDSTGNSIVGSNGGTLTRASSGGSSSSSSSGYLSGPMISGKLDIQKIDKDDTGKPVYMAAEAQYTKMVNADGASKYYVGPISSYSPASWPTYTNTVVAGGYKFTLNPAPTQLPPTTTNQLVFSVRPVDGGGSWSEPQPVPGTPSATPSINVTDQFIFVGSQGCSKPCTTNSWLPISQPTGSQGIVAASAGNTYAMGGQTIYQSSANGQGGWKEQAGLSGVIPLAVEGDNKFILGVSQSSQRPVRCSPPYTDDDSCKIDPTVTYKPMPGVHTMSLNPRSYQTYVAAASSGSSGNLYQRVDPGSIDHSAALDQTSQYIDKMDSNVNALGSATSNQYAQIEVGKVKKAANAVIKKITDISEERKTTAHERENVARQIQTVGGPDSQWKMHVLQTVAITVAIVLLLYVVGGFVLPPIINMSIAVVGMIIGVGIAISFAVNKQ